MTCFCTAPNSIGPTAGDAALPFVIVQLRFERILIGNLGSEQLKKIFDPFYTTKPVGEGTGLGLSISYGIIENHGGSITVESKIDSGTAFTINIPIDKGKSDDE